MPVEATLTVAAGGYTHVRHMTMPDGLQELLSDIDKLYLISRNTLIYVERDLCPIMRLSGMPEPLLTWKLEFSTGDILENPATIPPEMLFALGRLSVTPVVTSLDTADATA